MHFVLTLAFLHMARLIQIETHPNTDKVINTF